MKRQICKQIPDTVGTQVVMNSTRVSEYVMNILLFVGIIMNFVFTGGAVYFLTLTRSLQIILHFPLIKCKIPGTIMMMFQVCIPVAMFDIVDEEYFKYFLEFQGENEKYDS